MVCSDALTLSLCFFSHLRVCLTSSNPTRLLIMKKNDKKKFFRVRLRISQSARTNIVNAPIKKTSRPSVATHKNWMDPASRLKNDYCSFARRIEWKQKPKANNRRWGSQTFYCHNHSVGFREYTISEKTKIKMSVHRVNSEPAGKSQRDGAHKIDISYTDASGD